MTAQATNQFLTFTLGDELYALEVGSTREVLDLTNITPIPKTPEWIRGVLNLRGSVIPVLDLKLKLDMGRTERTKNTCVLIVEVTLDGDPMVLGILADSVQEVLEIEASQIEPPPRMGASVSTTFIRGMGRRAEGLFIILDVNRIFASSEIQQAVDAADEPLPAASPGEADARLTAGVAAG